MNSLFTDSAPVGVVSSFTELVETEFEGVVNALCWHRNLDGDFEELVAQLILEEDITVLQPEDLLALKLTEQGQKARAIILQDMQLLTAHGASPTLNLLKKYERDEAFDFIATDVYSYHVDSSPIATDTFLCTYRGAASDLIATADAVRKSDIPEVRSQLLELHDGPLDTFDAFLKEHYFDLHYEAKPEAVPVQLGIGNLWRLAVQHPNQKVPACVHRAPVEQEGEYRLLLIC